MCIRDRKKVIDLRDRDILVSAAAGSGKTAVLVERIVNRICVDNPVSYTHLDVYKRQQHTLAEVS